VINAPRQAIGVNPLLIGHTLLMDIGTAAGALVVSELCKCEGFLYVCTRVVSAESFLGQARGGLAHALIMNSSPAGEATPPWVITST